MNDVRKVPPQDETWIGKCDLGEWRERYRGDGLYAIYWRSPTWNISGYITGEDAVVPQLHATQGCEVCIDVISRLAKQKLGVV